MNRALLGPATALALALAAILVAVILDQGSPSRRDAALVVGSLAFYVLTPAAGIWLVIAAVRHRRARHDTKPR